MRFSSQKTNNVSPSRGNGNKIVEARGVEKAYGSTSVLKGVDLTVERGEVVCLIGRSGSGKSTFLRCVNELEGIDGGVLRVNGNYVGVRAGKHGKWHEISSKEKSFRRRHVGMVFQEYNLFSHMTVLDNIVEAPIGVARKPRAEAEREAKELLDWVGLEEKHDEYPAALSGGQQQRVAIARAIAMHPKVMLFDEVTSALDPELVNDVLDVMRRVANEGIAMIVVTHEMGFAREVADKVVFFDDGVVVEEGPPSQVLDSPTHERTRRFISKAL